MAQQIVMIQPSTALTGSFIKMLPLGLLYAVSKVVKEGFPVRILDTRIMPSWDITDLDGVISKETNIVGLSVMSGVSIIESIKISRYIKKKWPSVYIVWGGPHPTFNPDVVLSESSVDYVISGYGAKPFYQLVISLTQSKHGIPFADIKGLGWRDHKGTPHINDVDQGFEFIKYLDIPYNLIEENMDKYKNIDSDEKIIPMYSVMGCPYHCVFCSSPAQYSTFKKKWETYHVDDVIDHIAMVKERYGATFIYFIDDDSFVDLNHVEGIIDKINQFGIHVKLGFRGLRVNEVANMSDAFLEKLAEVGTNTLHIGVESGSDRLLKLIKKNITVSQIVEVNKKLAQHKKIRVFYNFIVGFPTESLEETKMTRDLILQLIKDNNSCCVIPLNKPRPLSGTELYDMVLHYGYKTPDTLEEWGEYDVESSNYNPVWLTDKHNRFIRMMFLCMYFIDDKIFKLVGWDSIRYTLLKVLAFMYKPVALFRFKKGFDGFLVEDKMYNMLKRFL